MEKWSQTFQNAFISLLNIQSGAFYMYINDSLPHPQTWSFSGGEEGNWSKFINLSQTQQTRLGQKKTSGREV